MRNLDIPSSTGGFVVRELHRFAYFIRQPHRKAAAAVVDAIGLILQAFPPPALSMFAIESGDWISDDLNGLNARVRECLIDDGHPINGRASLAGNQANIPDFSIEYAGRAIDRPVFKDANCSLTFSIASTVFQEHAATALALHRNLIERLACRSAYVELALEGHQQRLQGLARRYACVDISDVRAVARDLDGRLPGVFWKTYLDAELSAALGPADILSSLVSSNAEASVQASVRGGLEVTLGRAPVHGDIHNLQSHADRVALSRFAFDKGLLHVPARVRYFDANEEQTDAQAQEAWHLRWVRSA